ncbi:MAG TPA: folate-binding protein, partial [Rugosimonospora sp.]|nr:folate-binding protein [Rugosimonospora sp.]
MSEVRVGALTPESPDAPAVAHYGDPAREQRTLATAAGLVDRSHRGVVAIPGADRLTWLHSITTQYLTAPGVEGTELLVLSPHGHVEHHALLADDGTTTWLDTEPGAAPALLDFLTKMRFMMRVEPADVTDSWALLSLVGLPPDSPAPGGMAPGGPTASVVALGVPDLAAPEIDGVPPAKFASADVPRRPTARYPVAPLPDGGWVRRMPYGYDLLVPRDQVAGVAERLGVPWVGLWAFEALRVEARRPRLGFETDHRTIPAEVGWVAGAVHLDKGCYRGQETVARVHNLGRPPRRLVLLHLDGITSDELPAPGTEVTAADGRVVGFVGSAARHHELGQVALAVVKRSVPDG